MQRTLSRMVMSDVITVLRKNGCGFLDILHRQAFCTQVVSYAQLGLYRPPSYWSTRNRSIDIGPTVSRSLWRATCSFGTALIETTGSAAPSEQVGRRMQIDRFLVLQHEGGLHTPSHPYVAKLEQSSLDDHAAIASDIEAPNREFLVSFTPLAQ
jgi:hypothetical protein